MSPISTGLLSFMPGFLIGRAGHYYLGYRTKCIHHWIYGALIMLASVFYVRDEYSMPLLFFGAGVFISDLNDFFHFRIYGRDMQEKTRFWGID